MLLPLIKRLFTIIVLSLLLGANAMAAYPQFQCAYEKDHNPPLSEEAERYFQQARTLEKTPGIKKWPLIIENYQKAIELDHWKAMHNLAILYRTGKRVVKGHPGIEKDLDKVRVLHARMVELEVPLGYYNWATDIERGLVKAQDSKAASLYMFKAAQLGSPLAQVRLGNYFSFQLSRGEQRDDIADQYFRCAGAQDNPEALIEVASFYKISRGNKALATFYYQKAASLGSSVAFTVLEEAFDGVDAFKLGYLPDPELTKLYRQLHDELDAHPELTFPNLLKDHPLPRHPSQGYDADNPDIRPK